MPSHKLTPKQRELVEDLQTKGFIIHGTGYRSMTRNKPLRVLEEMGLCHFDFGPAGSWLTTYGFMPLWSDPVC